MGRFVVTIATNVSRTAQEPASWAPLMGSYKVCQYKEWDMGAVRSQGCLTVTMRTHRKVAQAMTRIPPPNRIIKPTFFSGLRLDFQSIGRGIDSRYTSVMTLNEK